MLVVEFEAGQLRNIVGCKLGHRKAGKEPGIEEWAAEEG